MATARLSDIPPTTTSAVESEALKAATFQRLHPRIYLERFLEEKVRPDGRSTSQDSLDANVWRNVEVNVGGAHLFLLLLVS